MKKNKSVLKLNTKPYSGFGIASFVLSLIVFVFSLVAIVMSAFLINLSLNQEVLIGILAWSSALLTATGLGLAILGEFTEDREQILTHLALSFHIIGLFYHGTVIWFGYFG